MTPDGTLLPRPPAEVVAEMLREIGKPVMADFVESLARDHADLREWAAKAAGALERAEYWAGKQVIATERSPQRDEWRALLAEYAERWGDT